MIEQIEHNPEFDTSKWDGLSYEELEQLSYVPLADNILVEMAPEPTKTKSGIITSINPNEKRFDRVVMPGTGRIYSNGNAARLKVEAGDYIELEPQFTQHYVERMFGGRMCYLIREADIRGVIVIDGNATKLRNRIMNTMLENE